MPPDTEAPDDLAIFIWCCPLNGHWWKLTESSSWHSGYSLTWDLKITHRSPHHHHRIQPHCIPVANVIFSSLSFHICMLALIHTLTTPCVRSCALPDWLELACETWPPLDGPLRPLLYNCRGLSMLSLSAACRLDALNCGCVWTATYICSVWTAASYAAVRDLMQLCCICYWTGHTTVIFATSRDPPTVSYTFLGGTYNCWMGCNTCHICCVADPSTLVCFFGWDIQLLNETYNCCCVLDHA